MKLIEIISETASGGSTSAGAIASVNSPMGGLQKRPSLFGYVVSEPRKKKKKKTTEGTKWKWGNKEDDESNDETRMGDAALNSRAMYGYPKQKERAKAEQKRRASVTNENLGSVKTYTVNQLAKKHKVSVDKIKSELKKGMKVELEHTTDRKEAHEIALDHLNERPDYYTMLIKAEKSPVKESMDFGVGKAENDPKYGQIWSSVLGGESKYDFSQHPWNDHSYNGWNDETDSYDDPPVNSKYNSDEELNVANTSADEIAQELGFEDAESMHISIDQFLAITTQWLKKNIGKRSSEQEVKVDPNPGGPTMVTGGKREGYFNEVIMKMSKIARIGKERGATHVWFA